MNRTIHESKKNWLSSRILTGLTLTILLSSGCTVSGISKGIPVAPNDTKGNSCEGGTLQDGICNVGTRPSLVSTPKPAPGTCKTPIESATKILGKGTSDSPYEIYQSNWKLYVPQWRANSVTGNYVLCSDLDFTGVTDFESWGGLKGVFDGQYFTIRNLTLNRPSDDSVSFIRALVGGTIQRIHFEGIHLDGNSRVALIGTVVQESHDGAPQPVISEITIDATSRFQGETYVGALVGIGMGGKIEKIESAATVAGNRVGYKFCDNSDNEASYQPSYLGGIIGSIPELSPLPILDGSVEAPNRRAGMHKMFVVELKSIRMIGKVFGVSATVSYPTMPTSCASNPFIQRSVDGRFPFPKWVGGIVGRSFGAVAQDILVGAPAEVRILEPTLSAPLTTLLNPMGRLPNPTSTHLPTDPNYVPAQSVLAPPGLATFYSTNTPSLVQSQNASLSPQVPALSGIPFYLVATPQRDWPSQYGLLFGELSVSNVMDIKIDSSVLDGGANSGALAGLMIHSRATRVELKNSVIMGAFWNVGGVVGEARANPDAISAMDVPLADDESLNGNHLVQIMTDTQTRIYGGSYCPAGDCQNMIPVPTLANDFIRPELANSQTGGVIGRVSQSRNEESPAQATANQPLLKSVAMNSTVIGNGHVGGIAGIGIVEPRLKLLGTSPTPPTQNQVLIPFFEKVSVGTEAFISVNTPGSRTIKPIRAQAAGVLGALIVSPIQGKQTSVTYEIFPTLLFNEVSFLGSIRRPVFSYSVVTDAGALCAGFVGVLSSGPLTFFANPPPIRYRNPLFVLSGYHGRGSIWCPSSAGIIGARATYGVNSTANALAGSAHIHNNYSTWDTNATASLSEAIVQTDLRNASGVISGLHAGIVTYFSYSHFNLKTDGFATADGVAHPSNEDWLGLRPLWIYQPSEDFRSQACKNSDGLTQPLAAQRTTVYFDTTHSPLYQSNQDSATAPPISSPLQTPDFSNLLDVILPNTQVTTEVAKYIAVKYGRIVSYSTCFDYSYNSRMFSNAHCSKGRETQWLRDPANLTAHQAWDQGSFWNPAPWSRWNLVSGQDPALGCHAKSVLDADAPGCGTP